MSANDKVAATFHGRHLVRTNNGTMIHSDECPMIRGPKSRAQPWTWADHTPLETVHRAVIENNYRACRICKPVPDGREERFLQALRRDRYR